MNEIYEVEVMTETGATVKRRVRAKSKQDAKHSVCASLDLPLNHALSAKKV